MVETQDRPKWLLELENRKRKPRLAHEAGAGAPCMVCSSACPGLDLHFWRKICKNCKCSRDDHDVEDDDFPQFDLLFGSSRKYKKKPIVLRVNNEKQHEGEIAFEWVPPDTTKELATDYMKALPADKLPIKGSAGAALRRQLLQKQLPLHDIDHKACDELSEQEKKQFEKYLENIKKYVGQGKVTKILGARPFDRSLMTPANATDMQRFSPQHKPSIPTTNIPQLRTPSSFTGKSPYGKNLYENHNKQDTFGSDAINNQNVRQNLAEKYNLISTLSDSETAKSEFVKGGMYNKGSYLNNLPPSDQSQNHGGHPESSMSEGTAPLDQSEYSRQGYMDTLKNPAMSLAHSKTLDDNAQIAESILADALLPPSTIHANDIIGSTLDEKGLMFIREKLTNKYSSQENQMVHNAQNISRDLHTPDSLRKGSAMPRNNNLPQSSDKESERSAIIAAMKSPSGTSTMLEDRIKRANNTEYKPAKAEMETIKPASQIAESVPLNSTLIRGMEEKGIPSQLKESNSNVVSGMPLHPASRITENPEQHPQVPIFSNNPDNSELSQYKPTDALSSVSASDPTYSPFRANPNNYQAQLSSSSVPCNVIHSEGLRNQIFPHEAIGATHEENQNLPNIEHLKGAMEELTMNSAKPQKCHKCEEEIRVGDVVVTTEKAKNATWHPGCFVCSMCNELLVDLVYFHYKNKLYCGRDLATLLGIPRCFACDELIFVREYTVAEGHNYHVKHFCCWDCDVPLAGQKYITENDRPLCLPCYQKTYAKTCNACEKVIAADQRGVAVKNLNFHASDGCFCCYSCKKSLLDSRMAVKEDKLFCSKECISQYQHSQP